MKIRGVRWELTGSVVVKAFRKRIREIPNDHYSDKR